MADSAKNNIILKGIGGFYYVKTADGVLEAKPKGIFRKQGISPVAGDIVSLEQSGGDYVISEIHARKNLFSRPPIANVDVMFLVVSVCDPEPNLLVIDTMTAIAEKKRAETVIVVTKTDLQKADEFIETYREAGFTVLESRRLGLKRKIKRIAKNKLSMFVGNSGVGKSTLINKICPKLTLATDETSKKLGRGKHTTRAVELYEFAGGYIADTPGFSALDITGREKLETEELADLFIDFKPYLGRCRFADCAHTVETGCAVLEAVAAGKIPKSRHSNYVELREVASRQPNY